MTLSASSAGSVPAQGNPAALGKRGGQAGGSLIVGSGFRLGRGGRVRHVVGGQVDAVEVRRQAHVVASQRLDPIDVPYARLVGGGVGVGRGRAFGVGHQGLQGGLALHGGGGAVSRSRPRIRRPLEERPSSGSPCSPPVPPQDRWAAGPQGLAWGPVLAWAWVWVPGSVTGAAGVSALTKPDHWLTPVGADRLHPVDVRARRRYRGVVVAGLGTGVALDHVEDLRWVRVGGCGAGWRSGRPSGRLRPSR